MFEICWTRWNRSTSIRCLPMRPKCWRLAAGSQPCRLGHHVLIAFDGTEYYRSAKLHCPNCSSRKRSGGTTEYFHTLVAATLVAPGHSRVVPLEPEFVVPQDGHDKQDCESMAARRWLAAHGPSYARLDPVYLGDDLYSRQPICQAVR